MKRPFCSIGLKIMFGSVSEHLVNLGHVKRCKTCVSGLNAYYFGVPKFDASILVHWTQNDVWECFRAFC
jgi:hypothetical protein